MALREEWLGESLQFLSTSFKKDYSTADDSEDLSNVHLGILAVLFKALAPIDTSILAALIEFSSESLDCKARLDAFKAITQNRLWCVHCNLSCTESNHKSKKFSREIIAVVPTCCEWRMQKKSILSRNLCCFVDPPLTKASGDWTAMSQHLRIRNWEPPKKTWNAWNSSTPASFVDDDGPFSDSTNSWRRPHFNESSAILWISCKKKKAL